MTTTDFSTTFVVKQSPQEVFNAITNVRGWWSEEIEGPTTNVQDEFRYHYQDVHQCRIKVVDMIPHQKVVWHIMENNFNFTQNKEEWTDTQVVFEISIHDKGTQLRFAHVGLVPEYECFDLCTKGWTNYINGSLHDLIAQGKGKPNPKQGGFNQQLIDEHTAKKKKSQKALDFQTLLITDASADRILHCVNNIAGWWTENVTGASDNVGDEFTVRFDDVHVSTQRLVEIIPGKKVVWDVTQSRLNFVQNEQEWTNTRITFEALAKDGKTHLRFTHEGLSPEIQCYGACSNAWTDYLHKSLLALINTGKGKPAPKQ